MVGDFYRLYTESVGDLGYIPYIPNSPTGGHSGRTGYIYIYILVSPGGWGGVKGELDYALVS